MVPRNITMCIAALTNEMPVPIYRVTGPKARPSGIQMARRAPSVTMPIPPRIGSACRKQRASWLALGICRCWKPRRLVGVVTCGSSSPTWSVLRSLSSVSCPWHLTLQAIREYWPRSTYKVRLPAGTYVKPGFASWCTLTDAQGSILSTDGPAAAPVLLAYQTPVELLREANGKQNQGGSGADFARTMHRQNTQRQARDRVSMGQVDTRWQQQYNSSTLWFQFTPQATGCSLQRAASPFRDVDPGAERHGVLPKCARAHAQHRHHR